MTDPRTEQELQIIADAKKGKAKAQKQLYERYASSMLSVCYRYAGDIETAKDLLQDGFIKMFSKIDSYAGIGSFAGWVRRIFVTTCLEHIRQKHALKFSVSVDAVEYSMDNQDVSVLDKIAADELMQLIGNLAEGYRTVFNLYAIEGYSHAEIAEMLGITEVTSRTQFMRARKLLQDAIRTVETK